MTIQSIRERLAKDKPLSYSESQSIVIFLEGFKDTYGYLPDDLDYFLEEYYLVQEELGGDWEG